MPHELPLLSRRALGAASTGGSRAGWPGRYLYNPPLFAGSCPADFQGR